ncbi:hypothetical protein [Brevundimonas diminuta]|uniref:hypothetical protein n=1 Tax=Brevundimonas diminuta TaxID=293 RepID=UPI0032082BA9
MLAALLVAGHMAAQEPPRFTLTPEPGDALKAELFRLEPGDPGRQARALLGEDMMRDDAELAVRSVPPIIMLYREGSLPDGPIVLYAGPGVDGEPDAACRLSRIPDGVVDNSHRAFEWCSGFILKTAPTLNIPPAPVH